MINWIFTSTFFMETFFARTTEMLYKQRLILSHTHLIHSRDLCFIPISLHILELPSLLYMHGPQLDHFKKVSNSKVRGFMISPHPSLYSQKRKRYEAYLGVNWFGSHHQRRGQIATLSISVRLLISGCILNKYNIYFVSRWR